MNNIRNRANERGTILYTERAKTTKWTKWMQESTGIGTVTKCGWLLWANIFHHY